MLSTEEFVIVVWNALAKQQEISKLEYKNTDINQNNLSQPDKSYSFFHLETFENCSFLHQQMHC